MNIFVIHDPRRPPEEWQRCADELRRQGIYHYRKIEGFILFPTVAMNINATHKSIVRDAQRLNEPEVCIMESDVWFPAADGWKHFIEHKPETFDLYLGGVYSELRGALGLEGAAYAFTPSPAGLHCYIIHSRYYDKFLATPIAEHIDTYQMGGDYKVCVPFAAIQHPGWSANNRKDVDYNVNLKTHDVYGWTP